MKSNRVANFGTVLLQEALDGPSLEQQHHPQLVGAIEPGVSLWLWGSFVAEADQPLPA